MFQAVTLSVLVLTLALPVSAQIGDKVADRFWESTKILEEMLNAPDGGIPEDLLQRAECLAVIPDVKEGAFLFGAQYGRGVITCRERDGSGFWGAPSMLSLSGGSFGLQVGGQSRDLLLVLTTEEGIDHLLSDRLTIGADIAAAAGPKGRSIGAEAMATMGAGMLTYSRSKGIFAGVSLDGSVLKTDHEANQSLYGHVVDPRDLLISGQEEVPDLAERFVEHLNYVAYRPSSPQSED